MMGGVLVGFGGFGGFGDDVDEEFKILMKKMPPTQSSSITPHFNKNLPLPLPSRPTIPTHSHHTPPINHPFLPQHPLTSRSQPNPQPHTSPPTYQISHHDSCGPIPPSSYQYYTTTNDNLVSHTVRAPNHKPQTKPQR